MAEEIRASNDDRADRDFQVDGGGISDQPVVIALQPVAQVGVAGWLDCLVCSVGSRGCFFFCRGWC